MLPRPRRILRLRRPPRRLLSHSIDSMKLQLVDLDQKTVKQSDLLRETKANEANYLLYLSKREQESTSDALDARNGLPT